MLHFSANYFSKLFLLCALGAVFGLAWFYALREHRVAFALRGADASIIEDLRSNSALADGAWSVTDVRELTRVCMDLLDGDISLNFDPVARAEFAQTCRSMVDAILARNPVSSRALVAKLRLTQPLDTALYDRAAALAPAEPWPLAQRLLSLARAGDALGPAILPDAAAADVARAFQTDWGQEILVNLYFANDAARALVLRVGQGRPAPEQAKFLARIKDLSAGGA